MEYNKLKQDILNALEANLQYLENKDYWNEINSICLYTDESFMSLSLVFNTLSFLKRKEGDEYYLTYKYTPAEWFSETIKEDVVLMNNNFFEPISKELKRMALNEIDVEDYSNILIKACHDALLEYKQGNGSFFYLFMLSDFYENEQILEWNESLIPGELKDEFKRYVENEL